MKSRRSKHLLLIAAVLLTMGAHVGPKAKNIEPSKTTRTELDAEFRPDAHTLDGRYAIYTYRKFSTLLFPGLEKSQHKGHGLMLVEFDGNGVVTSVDTHECSDDYTNTLCGVKPQKALTQLIRDTRGDDAAEPYGPDEIRYCDLTAPNGFQLSGDLKRQVCPPDKSITGTIGPAE